jgi:hypothetical protein
VDYAKALLDSKDYGPYFALLFGLVALLPVYAQVRTIATQQSRRFRDIDERTKAVAFWDAWLKAQAGVADGPAMDAARALAKQSLDDLGASIRPPQPGERHISPVRRFFLLYLPAKPHQWVLRVIYYVLILATAATLLAGAFDIAENKVSLVTFVVVAGLFMATSVLWFVISAVEHPRPQTPEIRSA